MRAGVSCESHIKGYYDENLSGKAFVRFHFLTDVGMVSLLFHHFVHYTCIQVSCMCHHTYIITHFVVHLVVNCCVSMFYVVLSQRVLFSPCKFYICMYRIFSWYAIIPKRFAWWQTFYFLIYLFIYFIFGVCEVLLHLGNGFGLGYLLINVESLLKLFFADEF